jgi:hypothetical protein
VVTALSVGAPQAVGEHRRVASFVDEILQLNVWRLEHVILSDLA